LLVATVAQAEGGAAAAGVREHDGFFLQLQYGTGWQDLSPANQPSSSIVGVAQSLGVSVGGAVARNLLVFGEFTVQAAMVLSLDLDFGDGDDRERDEDRLFFTFIGPGLAYYFGESNIFVSGTVGMARASFAKDEAEGTANGVGGRLGLGKEWWVSDQWGIGLAANVHYGVLSNARHDYRGAVYLLSFTATYN
jgi:hypothetical protein